MLTGLQVGILYSWSGMYYTASAYRFQLARESSYFWRKILEINHWIAGISHAIKLLQSACAAA